MPRAGKAPNLFIQTEGCENDVLAKVQEIQRAHPELDVFFDGDEYAICSRPRKKA